MYIVCHTCRIHMWSITDILLSVHVYTHVRTCILYVILVEYTYGLLLIYNRSTLALLVKELACNQKVAGLSPTSCRHFFAHEYTQLYLQNEEVFVTASLGEDIKLLVPGSWLILATCAI